MSPIASYVLHTAVTLLGVAALAVVLLYGARRAGIGRATGPLELVGKLPLDGRRVVYLVRVGPTIYVVGASESGMVKLGETTNGSLLGAEPAPAARDASLGAPDTLPGSKDEASRE